MNPTVLWNKQPLHTERCLGVLLPCNFGEGTYTSHTRTSANLFVLFFSRLLILGEPPERGFHVPSLFMVGIGRNMFLYQFY